MDCNKKRLEAEASGASASAANDTISYKWAKKLVFDKVKQNLGLDHTKVIGVGAAPISMESLEYFLSLDIPLLECYGMSETGGPHTGKWNQIMLSHIHTLSTVDFQYWQFKANKEKT